MASRKSASLKSRVKRVVVAGVQIAPKPNDILYNLEKVIAWFRRAVRETGAKLVVFPESITTGFHPNLPLDAFHVLLPPRIDTILDPIRKVCREERAYCVLPTYERGREHRTIYNSAFLIDARGDVAGVYRKTHPFPAERLGAGGWTTPGVSYPVIPTEFGAVGMMICYDGDFPEVSRILAIKGAQIIARPSALLRAFDIWELTNKMRAYDNHVYMIAVNAVGADAAGTNYFGHSMIVSPIAQTLALARGTEEIIYSELDPEPLKRLGIGSDTPMHFDHLEDRNVASYGSVLSRQARSLFEPARRYSIHKPRRKP
ncbi:MAG: carbon-nitrogen hydrolase family protein [Kiritimatiellae bacterium]|nr:carbon-nitrogen hydrolase family protein [Kiritimatiellia bacterium]